MNSTGQKRNSGYLVALLLVVGLTAFSNSMRELAEIHEFTLDSSRLITQYFAPAEIPQTVLKLESCDRRQTAALTDGPSLEEVQEMTAPIAPATVRTPNVEVQKLERRAHPKPSEIQIAKLNRLRQIDIDPAQFEFRVSTNDDGDSDVPVPAQFGLTMFKAKNRKHNVIRFSTHDREMILKTLNRSINLRTAS